MSLNPLAVPFQAGSRTDDHQALDLSAAASTSTPSRTLHPASLSSSHESHLDPGAKAFRPGSGLPSRPQQVTTSEHKAIVSPSAQLPIASLPGGLWIQLQDQSTPAHSFPTPLDRRSSLPAHTLQASPQLPALDRRSSTSSTIFPWSQTHLPPQSPAISPGIFNRPGQLVSAVDIQQSSGAYQKSLQRSPFSSPGPTSPNHRRQSALPQNVPFKMSGHNSKPSVSFAPALYGTGPTKPKRKAVVHLPKEICEDGSDDSSHVESTSSVFRYSIPEENEGDDDESKYTSPDRIIARIRKRWPKRIPHLSDDAIIVDKEPEPARSMSCDADAEAYVKTNSGYIDIWLPSQHAWEEVKVAFREARRLKQEEDEARRLEEGRSVSSDHSSGESTLKIERETEKLDSQDKEKELPGARSPFVDIAKLKENCAPHTPSSGKSISRLTADADDEGSEKENDVGPMRIFERRMGPVHGSAMSLDMPTSGQPFGDDVMSALGLPHHRKAQSGEVRIDIGLEDGYPQAGQTERNAAESKRRKTLDLLREAGLSLQDLGRGFGYEVEQHHSSEQVVDSHAGAEPSLPSADEEATNETSVSWQSQRRLRSDSNMPLLEARSPTEHGSEWDSASLDFTNPSDEEAARIEKQRLRQLSSADPGHASSLRIEDSPTLRPNSALEMIGQRLSDPTSGEQALSNGQTRSNSTDTFGVISREINIKPRGPLDDEEAEAGNAEFPLRPQGGFRATAPPFVPSFAAPAPIEDVLPSAQPRVAAQSLEEAGVSKIGLNASAPSFVPGKFTFRAPSHAPKLPQVSEMVIGHPREEQGREKRVRQRDSIPRSSSLAIVDESLQPSQVHVPTLQSLHACKALASTQEIEGADEAMLVSGAPVFTTALSRNASELALSDEALSFADAAGRRAGDVTEMIESSPLQEFLIEQSAYSAPAMNRPIVLSDTSTDITDTVDDVENVEIEPAREKRALLVMDVEGRQTVLELPHQSHESQLGQDEHQKETIGQGSSDEEAPEEPQRSIPDRRLSSTGSMVRSRQGSKAQAGKIGVTQNVAIEADDDDDDITDIIEELCERMDAALEGWANRILNEMTVISQVQPLAATELGDKERQKLLDAISAEITQIVASHQISLEERLSTQMRSVDRMSIVESSVDCDGQSKLSPAQTAANRAILDMLQSTLDAKLTIIAQRITQLFEVSWPKANEPVVSQLDGLMTNKLDALVAKVESSLATPSSSMSREVLSSTNSALKKERDGLFEELEKTRRKCEQSQIKLAAVEDNETANRVEIQNLRERLNDALAKVEATEKHNEQIRAAEVVAVEERHACERQADEWRSHAKLLETKLSANEERLKGSEAQCSEARCELAASREERAMERDQATKLQNELLNRLDRADDQLRNERQRADTLLEQMHNAELKAANDLQAALDRAHHAEGGTGALEKRISEQDNKIANLQQLTSTQKLKAAQSGQKLGEVEKRVRELEVCEREMLAANIRLDEMRSHTSDYDEVQARLRISQENEEHLRQELVSFQTRFLDMERDLMSMRDSLVDRCELEESQQSLLRAREEIALLRGQLSVRDRSDSRKTLQAKQVPSCSTPNGKAILTGSESWAEVPSPFLASSTWTRTAHDDEDERDDYSSVYVDESLELNGRPRKVLGDLSSIRSGSSMSMSRRVEQNADGWWH